jgi:hypothetical protein
MKESPADVVFGLDRVLTDDASTYGPPIESDAAGFGAPVFRQAGLQPALADESMVTESLVGAAPILPFGGVKDDAGRAEHEQRASCCPFPHGDGFGLSCEGAGNLLASQHDGRAGGSQQSIASGVRELELSTPSPPSPRGMVQDDAAQKLKESVESQHVWAGLPYAGTTGACENSQGREVVEQLWKSSWNTLSTAAAGGQTGNPMWGSGQYGGGSSSGTMWTEAAMSGRSWPSLLGAVGEKGSLASSEPFPRLSWASDETMLYGDGTDGSRNNPWSDTHGHGLESGFAGGTTREPRFESSDFSTAALTHSLQAEQGAARGEGASSWTLASDGTAAHDTQSGTRMEEGSIGSKRRIWYRAPNGQFASASQVRVGGEGGDGSSNGGGSSRGSEPFRRIRRRRKSEEVERKYRCDFAGCDKAYGTLNRTYRIVRGVQLVRRCMTMLTLTLSPSGH